MHSDCAFLNSSPFRPLLYVEHSPKVIFLAGVADVAGADGVDGLAAGAAVAGATALASPAGLLLRQSDCAFLYSSPLRPLDLLEHSAIFFCWGVSSFLSWAKAPPAIKGRAKISAAIIFFMVGSPGR